MLQYACQPFTTVRTVEETGCSCLVEPSQSATTERAIDAASDILAILSGMRVTGVCERTVRPITEGACSPGSSGRYVVTPQPWWTALRTIPLRGPRTTVTLVTIDGVALSTSEYKLLDGDQLLRVEGSWPTNNDLRVELTEVGSFGVTFQFGEEIEFIAESAAAELACELSAAYLGKRSTLPPGVVSATIAGASVVVDAEARDEPSTLPAVARFLSVYAPNGPAGSSAWAPEMDNGWTLVDVTEMVNS